jgi:hypothetical protein
MTNQLAVKSRQAMPESARLRGKSSREKQESYGLPSAPQITCLEVKWSTAGWSDVSRQNGYIFPPAVDFLPGKDFVEQLTGLIESYLVDCQEILRPSSKAGIEETITAVGRLTRQVLKKGEEAVKASMNLASDIHQYVHIHELSNNFLRTVTVLCDRMLGYPEQLSSVTRPKKETLQLHPELCGLLECAHILDVSSTHQGPRIPYAPHRTGREITYEEIANLYRTSRVNIRRLEVDKCRSKLRAKLKNVYD